jgi:hypothetical protein
MIITHDDLNNALREATSADLAEAVQEIRLKEAFRRFEVARAAYKSKVDEKRKADALLSELRTGILMQHMDPQGKTIAGAAIQAATAAA